MNEASVNEALKAGEIKYLAWCKSVANQGDNDEPLPAWSELTPAWRAQWAGIKPWWKSKMIWFNVLGLVGACAAAAELAFPVLQGAFPGSKVILVLAFVLPIGNAALRFITTTAIAWGWNK